MTALVKLPASFPAGTRFADVEDVPVSELEYDCTAWDVPGGRWFPSSSFSHNGTPLSEDRFRALVASQAEPAFRRLIASRHAESL